MSSMKILLLCIQACLVQNAFSQCLGGIAPGLGLGYGPALATPALATPALVAPALAAPAWDGLALGNTWGPAAGIAGYGLGPAVAPGYAAYGGAGIGDVAVAGELPVAGATSVAGQVPIIGAVQFGGAVPAAGAVSITGSCGCGCNGPYIY